MPESDNILISVDARHVTRILEGSKTVELRRRAIKLAQGSQLWIYSKVPKGYVEVLAIVDDVVAAAPDVIWHRYKSRSGITRAEFEKYFQDLDMGHAILFGNIRRLKPILSLDDIRERLLTFQPPQFYKRLKADSPELKFFKTALA